MQMNPARFPWFPGRDPAGRKNSRSPWAPRAEPWAGHPGAPQAMWTDAGWDGSHKPRPNPANIQVRELSWRGLPNPCPQSQGPGSPREQLEETHLCPSRLQALAGVEDLRLVQVLQMCVDTRRGSLGNFGVHLPKLRQLKLNGSHLGSLRDLGSSLGHLQVLWLARCGLADLDGISSLPELKELYVSYNDISDLSPLCLLEQLEVLDLEGNSVEDLEQVQYLQLCRRLATLTLEGNLVCLRPAPGPSGEAPKGYNYRAEVRRLLPQLQVLDEVPAVQTSLPAPQPLTQDWLLVKKAIKQASVLDSLLPRPGGALRIPECGLDLALPGPQPQVPEDHSDHASSLTHGGGQVLCGNPTRGLWERRQQEQAWASAEQLPWCGPAKLAASTPGPEPTPAQSYTDHLAVAGLQPQMELDLWPLDLQHHRAAAPWALQRVPEVKEDQAGPRICCSPLSLPTQLRSPRVTDPHLGVVSLTSDLQDPEAYNTEPSGSLCCTLALSPPKYPLASRGSRTPGSTELLLRGWRLRALGGLTALRTAEVASGPPAQGQPDTKVAAEAAAGVQGLQHLPPLNPLTPTPAHP
ncbi:leucine-rich repeat-containing protein 56-like isoform X2 [Ochotona princeps]|uniref:leucine-rich repeat-containing protein 56 isoform X2 n=1 Tax=Ochotona princeps TaxID=9978 RepID=UPI0027151A98|nr:leucine-rich repeat-containing protein 56 isoform X2 [Ochotona princeps]XP_058518594.1 leucine-rich repeat-containing protein 56-like isoform X2 [Ochotona princeps]